MNSIVRGHKACWSLLALGLSLLSAPAFSAHPTANVSSVFSFDLHITGAGVVEGVDNPGFLFGTTMDTSLTSGGTIFKVAKGGGAPQVIYQLKETDGFSPQATLLVGRNGSSPTDAPDHYLYGTTYYSARIGLTISYGSGTVFKVKEDGSDFTTLHTFATSIVANSVTGNALNPDGMHPIRALIQDANYLYGTTPAGGEHGSGTVFKVRKSDGQTTVLHAFNAVKVQADGVVDAGAGEDGDGAYPSSSLTLGQDGRLYGVTSGGGVNLRTSAGAEEGTTVTVGTGTIYSLDTVDGSTFTTLYSFLPLDDTATTSPTTNASGAQPTGTLLELSSTPGVFIGTASTGGNPALNPVPPSTTSIGFGTIYKFTAATATLTTLYNFDSSTGSSPSGKLVEVGNVIYGFTNTGSATSTPVTQFGLLYSIDPAAVTPATTYKIEHALTFAEGNALVGDLTKDSENDLYASVQSGNACTVLNGSGYGGVIRYSLTTGGSSTGYANCTQPSNSGGGAMSIGFMSLLGMLGLVPATRRRLSRFR